MEVCRYDQLADPDDDGWTIGSLICAEAVGDEMRV